MVAYNGGTYGHQVQMISFTYLFSAPWEWSLVPVENVTGWAPRPVLIICTRENLRSIPGIQLGIF